MIGEAIDTAWTLGWALLGWLIVFATVASILTLAAIATGAWGVRAVWRLCAPAGEPHDPSGVSRVAGDAPEPADAHTAVHVPAWARTEEEAA